MSFIVELVKYTIKRKKFFLFPIILVLLIFGTLLFLAESSFLAPFIYTLI